MRFLSASAVSDLGKAIRDNNPRITQVIDPFNKDEVADRTYKYLVETRRGTRFFLLVSDPEHPSTVAIAIKNLQMALNVLDAKCQQAIEAPLIHGLWDNSSFALWVYRTPLSDHSGLRFLQKRMLFPEVLGWLRRASQVSKRPCHLTDDLVSNFLVPLEYVASNSRLGGSINASAKEALRRIVHEDVIPVNVLQHGDLWVGNLLLKRPLNLLVPAGATFQIIDWGGAVECGYPFFDFIKFAMSCGISPARARLSVHQLSYEVQCEPKDAMTYLLCALGHLGVNLNCFPERRFVELCRSSFEYLEAAELSLTRY